MGNWMDGYLEKLAANRRENLEAGGPERIERQHHGESVLFHLNVLEGEQAHGPGKN